MHFYELVLTAVGLAMDAFAVAVCKGLCTQKIYPRHYLCVGLWFGGFQALMPLLGFFFGFIFQQYIQAFDHWIAFILLGLIGGNMIKEGLGGQGESVNCSFAPRPMIVMALATSIDALAVGITLALLPRIHIGYSVLTIGVITAFLSAIGLKVGNVFGAKYKSKAELFGGIILVLIGLKILLSHTGVLPF